MESAPLLDRISTDPAVLSGKPVVRGTRLSVGFLLGLLAQGATTPEILDEYPGLEEEDLRACLLFAARSVESVSFAPIDVT